MTIFVLLRYIDVFYQVCFNVVVDIPYVWSVWKVFSRACALGYLCNLPTKTGVQPTKAYIFRHVTPLNVIPVSMLRCIRVFSDLPNYVELETI